MDDAGFAGILPTRRPGRRLPVIRGVKVDPLRRLHFAALRFPLVGRLRRPLLGTPDRCDFATSVPTQNIGRAVNPSEVERLRGVRPFSGLVGMTVGITRST
jgi:hypothetical protein